ncbi:MPN527 family putative ECF transporter permease subunit [[Mycoplasma] collis]|uniref:MPN527 family putative ECF transporter permease subunit n=1 Tax=[Mycoplasma] collis TaxID=2127 RepID=UPI00051BECCF|nr:hypothetical protein [[Mycoplasma] collis]
MSKNLKYDNNQIFNVALTGLLLSFSLIALFISKYLGWLVFPEIGLKFDLSFLFIFAIFYFVNHYYGFIALIIRFIFGPFITVNSDVVGWIGHFILFTSNLIFIIIFFLLNFLLKKINNYKKKFIVFSVAIISTSLIMTFLNYFLFTPLYFKIFGLSDGFFFNDTIKAWEIKKQLFKTSLNFLEFCLILFLPFNLTVYTFSSIFIIFIILFVEKNYNLKKIGKNNNKS